MLYRRMIKPILFKMDPEKAHHLTIGGLKAAGSIPGALAMLGGMYGWKVDERLASEVCGIRFPSPVGLAAGLDKNGQAVPAFSRIGFGFIEVGTVTPKGQPGNELPRLFRLPPDDALINRMGFNNDGADKMADHLRRLKQRTVPVAVNIGKNKLTPNEDAVSDYRACIDTLFPYADFFVVNISSPNTPDLRKLQHGEQLSELLSAVCDEMRTQHQKYAQTPKKPIFVKIAPDLNETELKDIIDVVSKSEISGIIATNTTLSRDGLQHPNATQAGGLSGRPLTARSTEVIRTIFQATDGKLPIIGVGGIFNADDAYEKIRAGASLVEVYTALIYRGPGLLKEIGQGLIRRLEQDGFSRISDAVGADFR
ncbi:quinone-dependent dihydroorotate dehydrogenase [Marinicrinis lubricantis]|uniref:Dihydroorotate dehydrogenase (quinone) n=1 Tax=Marinicrinis lubricantis TaxID=2086470 RepID=A0ABW1ITB7_9BACL